MFCFFLWNFLMRHIWGWWFQRWQYFFKILGQKSPNKRFFEPKFGNFASLFQFDKFEDADLKYDNGFLILPHKYPNNAFSMHNLGIAVFLQNFAFRHIWTWWFQILQ